MANAEILRVVAGRVQEWNNTKQMEALDELTHNKAWVVQKIHNVYIKQRIGKNHLHPRNEKSLWKVPSDKAVGLYAGATTQI